MSVCLRKLPRAIFSVPFIFRLKLSVFPLVLSEDPTPTVISREIVFYVFNLLGVRDGGRGARAPPQPPKIRENNFRAIIMKNSGIWGQKSC